MDVQKRRPVDAEVVVSECAFDLALRRDTRIGGLIAHFISAVIVIVLSQHRERPKRSSKYSQKCNSPEH